MKTTISYALLALAAATLFAAFGFTARATAGPKPVIITMGDDMKFSPAKVTVQRGQMVAWQNLSKDIHNVVDNPAQTPKPGIMTLPKGAAPFDSGLMKKGQTYVQKFDVAGTYNYACSLHIANKMFGQITVK